MIEVIGVVTILVLVAAAVIPNVIRRVDRAAWTKEASDLKTMADGLLQSIVRNKIIPREVDLAQTIATEVALSTNQVSNTPRGLPRRLVVDPAINLGGAAGLGRTISYTQNAGGLTIQPRSARVLLVSTVAGALPGALNFNNIWDTPEGQLPSSLTNVIKSADDLRIQRVDYGRVFYRLFLNRVDPATVGRFAVDTNASVAVAGTSSGWYLDGTVVGLYDTNNAAVSATLEFREVLQRDTSYVYELGIWRGKLIDGTFSAGNGALFNAEVDRFLSKPDHANTQGSTTHNIAQAMLSYMLNYELWAFQCFPRHGIASLSSVPEYTALDDARKQLEDAIKKFGP